MKTPLLALASGLLIVTFSRNAHAQAFINDNDGLLDIGEAPGFPDDPASATGTLNLSHRGIEDLDGTGLLTRTQELSLSGNNIASIETGDFDGLANLQSLSLTRNRIASIEPGDFDGLANLQVLGLGGNNIAIIESGDFDGLADLQELMLWDNGITSIESGDFDGLTNLLMLGLEGNNIVTLEAGAFDGLENLQVLWMEGNGIASIEAYAFAGLRELQTLTLESNLLTELNFTGATFDSLQPDYRGDIMFPTGLTIDSSIIESLLVDYAELSLGSFHAIVGVTTSIIDVSLAGLTFSDAYPSDLSVLLDIATLDNVRVDPTLYSLYAAEFDAFAAMPGNTVTIVPEPSAAVLLILATTACLVCHNPLR